jgi:hypothetical protein
MKSSNYWLHWLRSTIALVLTLGFFGWRPVPVSAAVEYNEIISFIDDFDACSGERVSMDGVQHIVGRITTGADGKLYFGFTRNTKGAGIGQISGDQYILTDAYTRASLEWTSGEVTTFTEQYNSRLIRKGEKAPNDDTFIHFLSKLTIDANGEVTTVVEIQSVECR